MLESLFQYVNNRCTDSAVPAMASASTPPRRKRATTNVEVVIPLQSRSRWDGLPQELKTISLRFAAESIRDARRHGEITAHSTSSCHWLLGVARVSKAWYNASIDVLYETPELDTAKRCLRFFDHVFGHPERSSKVFNLELDVRELCRKLKGPTASIEDLLTLFQRGGTLKSVNMYDLKDTPDWRKIGMRPFKWAYPDQIFETINQFEHKLIRWSWNGHWFPDFGKLEHKEKFSWVVERHNSKSFASLIHLELSNIDLLPDYSPFNSSAIFGPALQTAATLNLQAKEILAGSVSVLQNLRNLSFESCSIVDGYFMDHLPSHLQVLSLDNCIMVDSEGLETFLVNKGGNLKELILKHCQTLNLDFLKTLGQSCPALQVLIVDCLYYNTFTTSKDSDPYYDFLIDASHEPDWPSSLHHLELRNLRKWLPESAQMFFMSIVKAAPILTSLQNLIIDAKVDENWRERSRLRIVMAEIIRRMFKRNAPPPSTHLRSMQAFDDWKNGIAGIKEEETDADARPGKNGRKRHPKSRAVKTGGDDKASRKARSSKETRSKRRRTTRSSRAASAESDHDFDDAAPVTRSRRKARDDSNAAPNPAISIRTRGQKASKETPAKVESDAESDTKRTLRPRRSARHSPRDDGTTGGSKPSASHANADTTKDSKDSKESKTSEMDTILTNLKRGLLPVQGLCDVCDISIDNQRPTDLQYTENHFLDSLSEDDSDEDFVIAGVEAVGNRSESSDGERWGVGSESEAEFTESDGD